MNDIYEIRRSNLLQLTDGRGKRADLARKVGTTPARISQLLADPDTVTRPARISTDVARAFEKAMGLPHERLDMNGAPLAGAAPAEQTVDYLRALDAMLDEPVHFDRLLLIAEVARAEAGENIRAPHIKEIQFILALCDKATIKIDARKAAAILRRARADAKEHGGEMRPTYIKDLLELLAEPSTL